MRAYRARKKSEREAVAKCANFAHFEPWSPRRSCRRPGRVGGEDADRAARDTRWPAGRWLCRTSPRNSCVKGWGAHESALCIARKNAKSAIAAVLALGHLCGPLRSDGWRGAVASITKEKAAELRNQVAAIAEASKAGRPNSAVALSGQDHLARPACWRRWRASGRPGIRPASTS